VKTPYSGLANVNVTARLIRSVVEVTLDLERHTLKQMPVWARVPYILRLVSKLVRPTETILSGLTAPTHAEIEAEIRKQMVDRLIEAL